MLNSMTEATDLLAILMSTAASALSPEGLESAVTSAMTELGWTTFPVTDEKKCYWIMERAKRHASFILLIASAQKFKYKQVNLQQRFEHYEKLIKLLDAAYEKALADDTTTFSNVAAYKMFGTVIGPGFVYDGIGQDITYETDISIYLSTGE